MMDGNLPELPNGWVWTKLGKVCLNPQYGWTTRAATKGTLRLLRTTDISSGTIRWSSVPFCEEEPSEKEKYLLKDGDIVISRAGSVGYSHLIKNPKEAIFASYLIRFRPLIEEYYLALFLKSPIYWESISERSIGIAIPNVNATKLKQIPLPLPPLPEQQRIVAKIEELFTKLDAGIDALKKVRTQLKRYRQAVLKHAFEGKLTEEWREMHREELEPASVILDRIKEERKKNAKKGYKELPPVDVSDLSELPEGWVWVNLSKMADFKNGINFNKDQKGSKGILTIDVLNMYSRGIFVDLNKLYRINKFLKEDYFLKYGDVLFVRSSVKREGVGWTSAFKEIGEPVTFCGFIIRARLLDPQILPEYISYFFRTSFARELVISKGSQVTITNITQNSLGKIPVPLTFIAEQKKTVGKIEQKFSVADEIEKTVENTLKQAERLRQSILRKAFEGKLVPQSPNDEPASVLLERIRAEKAKKASKKTRKSKKSEKYEQKRLINNGK